MPNNYSLSPERSYDVEPTRELTLEEQYPDLEFYRGVPVFRVGDRVTSDGFETFVVGIHHDLIDDWLDNRNYTPRMIVDNVHYTNIEDPEDMDEWYPELLFVLELVEAFKPKGKSGLVKFLEKHT